MDERPNGVAPVIGNAEGTTPGAPSGATATNDAGLDAVLDALPFPVVLVERGTGAVLRANQLAVAAGLDRAAGGTGVDEQGGFPNCHLTDEHGKRVADETGPMARAARGEAFSGLRVSCQPPAGADHRRTTYLVSARPAGGARGASGARGTAARGAGAADSDGGGEAGPSGEPLGAAMVVSFIDVTEAESAQASLRESVRGRDEFVSVATHELKEPLTSILLSLQLLELLADAGASVPSDEVRQTTGVIRRQGDRLARLIENLLDVSRINNDRLHLDREAVDLCDLVHDCVETFADDARHAGSDLSLHACMPCIGYFDRVRVEQVVSNLLSNAIKYGAGRPIRVRLECTEERATLQVADNGIGIAPADQARVFERFERATVGHMRRSLGLGLYIVRSIVEAHGGTVGVRSAPGAGSTFTVDLPRHRLPGRAVPPAGAAVAQPMDGVSREQR